MFNPIEFITGINLDYRHTMTIAMTLTIFGILLKMFVRGRLGEKYMKFSLYYVDDVLIAGGAVGMIMLSIPDRAFSVILYFYMVIFYFIFSGMVAGIVFRTNHVPGLPGSYSYSHHPEFLILLILSAISDKPNDVVEYTLYAYILAMPAMHFMATAEALGGVHQWKLFIGKKNDVD